MLKHSPVRLKEDLIGSIESSMDAPLWLLQKDDTRFLYISILLSLAVHIILFIVMAATRIFHPFAGTSQEFDLVWFSPTPISSPVDSSSPKPSVAKQRRISKTQKKPATETKLAASVPIKAKIQPPPPAKTRSQPKIIPPQAPPVTTQVQTSDEMPIEKPSEMVISRFGGKVVEVVDKKADVPTFTVMSSVKMKSKAARAVVQTIHVTGQETPKTRQSAPKAKPSERTVVASLPKKEPTGKPEKTNSVTAPQAKQPSGAENISTQQPIQGKASSASVATTPQQPSTHPPVNRDINSFAAALEALSAAGSKLAAEEQAAGEKAAQTQESRETGTEKKTTLQAPTEATPATRPPTVEKPVEPEVKQAPQVPPTPQLILQPPVAGDLKLVITGDVDVKVEVSFIPFPKTRRSKPFTRREAEVRRSIVPKMVRTKENVHEAVVEITEEGIYSLVVRPGNGKQGTAELVLKIRESHPGASTKKLGSRKIDGASEVAKVLMPEGILWNDDSYFSGNMEDADSITKFNSESGLMWREYK